MAEKEKIPKEVEEKLVKEVIKETAEETGIKEQETPFDLWVPKTEIGRKVKNNEITNIDQILDQGLSILESEIIDKLLPNLESEFINVGQSKGKFGGGKRSIWKQTQKKTREGNKPHFAALVVVGNKDGYVGLGYGKSKETVPAREKAIRRAKLNIIKIRRGCGDWACNCREAHSIPLKVEGKTGSVKIRIMPAPKGTGLCIEKECRKILELAGIKDVYSKTFGQTKVKINLANACFKALKELTKVKITPDYIKKGGVIEGSA